MKDRTYDELLPWEKEFFDLVHKVGNDVWGAELEDYNDIDQGHIARLIVFCNTEEARALVPEYIAGYKTVTEVYDRPIAGGK